MHCSKYQWPASALTAADMKTLHAVREARPDVPITELIARAVRRTYGNETEPDHNPAGKEYWKPCVSPSTDR